MWKRIQTLYTIAATLLTTSMFFCRLSTIIGPEGTELKIMYYEKMPYLVMLIMLLTAGICSIFTYINGYLQSRVCTISALLSLGFQIWLGVDFLRYHSEMVFSVTMLFPLVSTILYMLAARNALIDAMAIQTVRKMKKK